MPQLLYYQTPTGRRPFTEWFDGPGYRVYFARLGEVIVLLLCGGDKRTQQKDIERAKYYFRDYKARTAHKGRAR